MPLSAEQVQARKKEFNQLSIEALQKIEAFIKSQYDTASSTQQQAIWEGEQNQIAHRIKELQNVKF